MSNPTFAELGLAAELMRAIEEQGYSQPTPIQQQAIPKVIEGRDLMAAAQTGTGKTAAFALPILQRLLPQANRSASPARHPVRALILTPTRELAIQVEESFQEYGKHVPLKCAVVYGGVNIDPQTRALKEGVEILVATPGRLLDHVQQRTLVLSQVQFLVLDEADRMLDMGFMPDIRRILALLPKERQNLLFSATFSEDIRGLANSLLRDPLVVEVAARNSTSSRVQHAVYEIAAERKRECLTRLLKQEKWHQVLVFARTKQGAEKLAHQLHKAGISATAIHGDKSQMARIEALTQFKDGRAAVLVATDVAARGLDIEELPVVINYELPTVAEDYVHRIGRTGRAGASGQAISLVSPEERKSLALIEKMIGDKIERRKLEGLVDFEDNAEPEPVREAPKREQHRHDPHSPQKIPGEKRRHEAEREQRNGERPHQREARSGDGEGRSRRRRRRGGNEQFEARPPQSSPTPTPAAQPAKPPQPVGFFKRLVSRIFGKR